MRTRLLPAAIIVCSVATIAIAHSGVKNAAVMERMRIMTASKEAIATLGAMAKGERGFDTLEAERAQQILLNAAEGIESKFRAPETDPKSEALPLIWEEWDQFLELGKASEQSLKSLDISTLSGVRTGLPNVGAACLACHQKYRKSSK